MAKNTKYILSMDSAMAGADTPFVMVVTTKESGRMVDTMDDGHGYVTRDDPL
jgi:hypothetical protein